MVKSWSITKEETSESREDDVVDSNTFLMSMSNHMYRRSGDDETFRKRLVKVLELIRDNQTFETDLNLIRDLEGRLVRISITRSKGISGIGSWLLHMSLCLLLLFNTVIFLSFFHENILNLTFYHFILHSHNLILFALLFIYLLSSSLISTFRLIV